MDDHEPVGLRPDEAAEAAKLEWERPALRRLDLSAARAASQNFIFTDGPGSYS